NETQSKLPFEALPNDVHVQQSEKAAAKPKTQGLGGLRLVGERRIIETKLFQSVAQALILAGFRGVKATENHRLQGFESGQGLGCRMFFGGYGIADARLRYFFNTCHQEADLARPHFRYFHRPRRENTETRHFKSIAAKHHADACSLAYPTVKDADHHHGAVIGIEPAIDDEGSERFVRVSFGR